MRLKLELRHSGALLGLTVTADPTATVGDVAGRLAVGAAGGPSGGQVTLRVLGTNPVVLDPTVPVLDAPLRSGQQVELVPAGASFATVGRGAAAAVLRVVHGPDAGAEFELPFGSSVIGRDPGADIRLADPLVSKRHARINVGDVIEIVDLNSANGVLLGGRPVPRAALDPADSPVVGDTTVCVVRLRSAPSGDAPPTPSVDFTRSPRVVARFPETRFPAPTPPERPQRQPFPWLTMVAPLIAGVVLFLITRQIATVLFVALSPVLAIGTYVDHRVRSRSTLKAQRAQFDAALTAVTAEVEAAQRVERAVRQAEAPSLAESIEQAERLGALLWTHRPEHESFLTLRLGLGESRSRCVLELPGGNATMPEFWSRLLEARDRSSRITEVPVVADLRSAGGLGLVGADELRGDIARSAVLQLAVLHSPAELVVAAIVPGRRRREWDWLKWLPHTTSPHSPLAGAHLADNPGSAAQLLALLEDLVGRRSGKPAFRGSADERAEQPPVIVPAVVLVVDDEAAADRARIIRIAERGPDAGVHVVWTAGHLGRVPAAARTFAAVSGDQASVGFVRLGEHDFPVAFERASVELAERVARALAPVVDAGAPVDDQAGLPDSVSYAALAGEDVLGAPSSVIERWNENGSVAGRPAGQRAGSMGLRALVGSSGNGAVHLDLRRDGPHALVGGTTGAGKSEFLQSWVLGLATAYSPDRVTFLFVDYKGGSAFADCIRLPHTVGLVTDLSPRLVRRALTSFRAELRHREQLLKRKGAKDLMAMEAAGDPETPPNLIIVVDEFAALVQEMPEFVDGVVDVAQRGRSLGLHLILATQRPAGVIRDNLRANTNLRIALRMADPDDSTDVLGDPLAYHFSASLPGRAAVKAGPGTPAVFQAAYAGGWTTATSAVPPVAVEGLGFDSTLQFDAPPALEENATRGPNDISRIVATVRRATTQERIQEPRRPWLPELAPVYDLARLPQPRSDTHLLLGVVDRPSAQSQPTFFYEPDRDGNMAVFGTGGSGKSTALRSLAIASAATLRGGPVQVYALDFGAHGLAMLAALPHVGAVIDGDDGERVVRLLRMLRDVVDERAARYAAASAATITEYRAAANRPDEPRILLLIDGIGAFRDQYEVSAGGQWFSVLAQIATDGRQVGVHLVLSGDRANSIPPSLSSTVQRRIVLRLPTEDEYTVLGVARDVLDPTSPPGRGVVDGDELQIAVLGGDPNIAVQAREVAALAAAMTKQGVRRPPAVERLPAEIDLDVLPRPAQGRIVLGLADDSLQPIDIEASGLLLLAGSQGSGRTTVLAAIGASAARAARSVVHFSARRPPIPGLAAAAATAVGPADAAVLAEATADRIERQGLTDVVILIEHAAEFANTEAEPALERLARVASRSGCLVVGESETAAWSQYSAIAQVFRSAKRGILLVPSDTDGDTLFGVPTGRLRRDDFPPGRGFLVERGRAVRVQFARPGGGVVPIDGSRPRG